MADDIKIGEIAAFACIDTKLTEKDSGKVVEGSEWSVGADDGMPIVVLFKPDVDDNPDVPNTLWIEASGIQEDFNDLCRLSAGFSAQLYKHHVLKLIELLQAAAEKMSDYHDEEESP